MWPTERRVACVAYGYAVLVALTLGYFLLGIPIQFSDSFGNMLKLSASWRDLLMGEFTQHAYLRPLLWAELKLVYDLSGGNYFAWFRGVHAAQVIVLLLLYVALVRPRTMRDAALVPFGIAVLVSLHTFGGTIREAFPVNTFLTLLILCFTAAVLSFATYRWWNDVLAVLLFVIGALTVESGLLVAVIVAGGALMGLRGISRIGVSSVLALLAGYFVLRFPVLHVGAPDLMERSAGFGLSVLDPPELVARFGTTPYGFYAYNVVTSAISVLLSEPTGGVFRMLPALARLELQPSMIVNLIASLSVTALIAWFAWTRRDAWLAWRLDRDDQLVLLFLIVLCANATFSYAYQKDTTMSPAGAFLAVAAFIAARRACASLPVQASRRMTICAAVCCAMIGTAWASRVAGTYFGLRDIAYIDRTEWAYAELERDRDGDDADPAANRLFDQLRNDALLTHPAPPSLRVPFARMLGLE